jgi:catechol 2,3-dioxygenase-like lactoylglutathione lyase family enzyme
MKIEHVALQVSEPAAAAEWYVANLGFCVRRAVDQPVVARFLADSSGVVMLELYNNPRVPVPAYGSMDPLLLHVAFVCDEVPATVERLLKAGATLVAAPALSGGDELAMLRDPWGLAIQLVRRRHPMLSPASRSSANTC